MSKILGYDHNTCENPIKSCDKDLRFVYSSKESVENASDINPGPHQPIPAHFRDRFMHAPKARIERGLGPISAEEWQDWRWQQRRRFRFINQLEGRLM